MSQFVARHPLNVLGVKGQQLFVAQQGVISGAANRIIFRPRRHMLVDVFLGLLHGGQRPVAPFDERRQAIGRQLCLRGVGQRPAQQAGRAGQLLGAGNSEEVARLRDQRVARRDVRRLRRPAAQ